MKFAHIADCHLGGWRDPKLREIGMNSFKRAIAISLEKGVDFILIAGDLFNTAMPPVDYLKETVKQLKLLRDNNILVYTVAGSHDFSPSGRTMLDVLEHADLLINVVRGEIIDDKLKLKFTVDPKTNAKITGMIGKRGMLEKTYYENLAREHLESEPGFKIFMFHTAITELKPKDLAQMESAPISLLPKNFNYYAGGHVHIVEHANIENYSNVIYPGPTFPNSFSELEKLGSGSFCLYDNGNISHITLNLHPLIAIAIDCNHLNPDQITGKLKAELERDLDNAIVTIRLSGILESGRISDVDFKSIFAAATTKGAHMIMKNTSGLKIKDFEEIHVDTSDAEKIEHDLIREHLGQVKVDNLSLEKEERLTKQLMSVLHSTKQDGEKVADFEKRIKKEAAQIIGLPPY